MSGKINAISKGKATEMCADMLYAGKKRKDIVQELTKSCGLSERAIDNYIKDARSIVLKRQQADEETASKVRAEQTEEITRRLGISREWLFTTLKRVADLDVRKIFKEDGTMRPLAELDEETARAIASIEITEVRTADGKIGTNKKVKGDPRITAAVEIGKLAGYYPQTGVKAELKDEKTGKSFKITLNLA